MPFIKFTQNRKTVEATPQEFCADRVYELNEASCERWKRRGAAVDATEAEFKAQQKPPRAPRAQGRSPAPPAPAAPASALTSGESTDVDDEDDGAGGEGNGDNQDA
jgi:hypothetical protein